jgi:multidrug efflux pump subunit AcrA (membrane-fusion protein)
VDGLDTPLILEVGRNASLIGAGSVVDSATRTVPVILELDNPGGRLSIGAAVRVRLHTGRVSRAIAVPATAILYDQGQPVVFVQLGGESFARRAVDAGLRDGDRIAVTRGLELGERVVTRGTNQVRLAAAAPAAAGHGHAH